MWKICSLVYFFRGMQLRTCWIKFSVGASYWSKLIGLFLGVVTYRQTDWQEERSRSFCTVWNALVYNLQVIPLTCKRKGLCRHEALMLGYLCLQILSVEAALLWDDPSCRRHFNQSKVANVSLPFLNHQNLWSTSHICLISMQVPLVVIIMFHLYLQEVCGINDPSEL